MTWTNRVLITLGLLCGAGPVAAQVPIHVVDLEGRPIADVQIDVFGTGEHLGRVLTAIDGTTELVADPWSAVRRITLRHLAYRTRVVQAGSIPADGVLVMEPAPVHLDEIQVDVPGHALSCPLSPDPEARAAWERAAANYAPDTGLRAISGTVLGTADRVPLSALTSFDEDRGIAVVYGQSGAPVDGGSHTALGLEERILSGGYSWPALAPGGWVRDRDTEHAFVELDFIHAYHFATPVFGQLHDFALVSKTEQRTTIAFCPNGEGTGASLHGTLTLNAEGAFAGAAWRFEREGEEGPIGGEVRFRAHTQALGSLPHLLAAEGTFFRHVPGAKDGADQPLFYRELRVHRGWTVLPGPVHPCKETGAGYWVHRLPPRTTQDREFVACVARIGGLPPP